MSSTDGNNGVTFIWTIENLDATWWGNIESPVFLSNSLHDTEWKLNLYPLGTSNDDYISINLTRCGSEDKGIERIILDCELSILDENDKSIKLVDIKNHGFLKGHTWWSRNFVLRNEVFYSKRIDYFPWNILTVRCRLWKRFNENTLGEVRFSGTKIERCCFVWTIEEFCRLRPFQRKKMYLKKSHSDTSILSFEFFIGRNGEPEIEICPTEPRKIQASCFISVLDVFGESVESQNGWHAFEFPIGDFRNENASLRQRVWRFPSFIPKSKLVENENLHLPMGILSLRFECYIYSEGENTTENTPYIPIQNFQLTDNLSKTQNDEKYTTEPKVHGNPKLPCSKFEEKACGTETSASIQKYDKQCMTEPEQATFELSHSSELEMKVHVTELSSGSDDDVHSHNGFMHDLQCMYEEGILSDFVLRSSDNKDFPVHKNILSARSPVFRAMFTTAMKEKDGDSIDVPDVDAGTLQRMLKFVYSNRMDAEMRWENAMNLYFAADKYAIDALKRASCSVLKAALCATNACEILVYSYLHGDQDLKSFTKDFIVDNHSDVIDSEEWNKLLKSNIHLTVEILSELYSKKMKNK